MSAEFDEKSHVLGTDIEPLYKIFQSSVEDGVFFTSRYFNNSKSSKAMVLDAKTGEKLIYSTGDITKSSLISKEFSAMEELIKQIEKGSFRQTCYNGPSEGSMSLLLVKLNGRITAKYEASQYDYSHLNKSEKEKIKNALEIIRLLETKS